MTLKPTDVSVARALIAAARAAGWVHQTYGDSDTREHVWRSPRPHRHYAEKVSLWHGGLEYRQADAHAIKSTMQPESAADARKWLVSLGLIEPTAVELAAAMVVTSA